MWHKATHHTFWYSCEVDLDLGHGQDICRGTHAPQEVHDSVLGAMDCSHTPSHHQKVGEGPPSHLTGGRLKSLHRCLATVQVKIWHTHIRVAVAHWDSCGRQDEAAHGHH